MTKHPILDSPIFVALTNREGNKAYVDPSHVGAVEELEEGSVLHLSNAAGSIYVQEGVEEVLYIIVEGARFRSEASLEALVQVMAKEIRQDAKKKYEAN